MRIAAGSILNTVPDTTIGTDGASSDDRTVGPARPQHVGDVGGAEQDDGAKHDQRRQQRAVSVPGLRRACLALSRTTLCEVVASVPGPQIGRDYATRKSHPRRSGRSAAFTLSLRIALARNPGLCKKMRPLYCVRPLMTPESLQKLFALLLGFAVAGIVRYRLPALHRAACRASAS